MFFLDPALKAKAMEHLDNMRQGRTEFMEHYQLFSLKLQEAGLKNAPDEQKIIRLKKTLSKDLLTLLAGGVPSGHESYEEFVKRAQRTYDERQMIKRLTGGNQLGTPTWAQTSRHNNTRTDQPDTMDWQPTPVGAAQVRNPPNQTTRRNEFWGTTQEVRARKERGDCLRCGRPGHLVRNCTVKLLNQVQAMAIAPTPVTEPEEESEN
jgi:hypothetical protein